MEVLHAVCAIPEENSHEKEDLHFLQVLRYHLHFLLVHTEMSIQSRVLLPICSHTNARLKYLNNISMHCHEIWYQCPQRMKPISVSFSDLVPSAIMRLTFLIK